MAWLGPFDTSIGAETSKRAISFLVDNEGGDNGGSTRNEVGIKRPGSLQYLNQQVISGCRDTVLVRETEVRYYVEWVWGIGMRRDGVVALGCEGNCVVELGCGICEVGIASGDYLFT